MVGCRWSCHSQSNRWGKGETGQRKGWWFPGFWPSWRVEPHLCIRKEKERDGKRFQVCWWIWEFRKTKFLVFCKNTLNTWDRANWIFCVCDFIYFLFLKLLQSFCCPRWYEISYILIHSISLFYIYVRTLVNIFNLVIQFFHFVNLHWVVYCFSFLSFSCIFLSRTYYFSVRFYGFNSVFFLIFLFYFLFVSLFCSISWIFSRLDLPAFLLDSWCLIYQLFYYIASFLFCLLLLCFLCLTRSVYQNHL